MIDTFWDSVLSNVVAGLIVTFIIFIMSRLINGFTKYTVVIVEKRKWEAFKRVAPQVAKRVFGKD